MIKIPKRSQVTDERSILANTFCDYLVKTCNNDLDKAVQSVIDNQYYEMFENAIRNFYELVSCDYEIPLFVYAERISLGKDGYGDTEEEHLKVLEHCRQSCIEYYLQNN